MVLLPPLFGHVCADRPVCLQRSPPLRLHPHLQGFAGWSSAESRHSNHSASLPMDRSLAFSHSKTGEWQKVNRLFSYDPLS